MNRYELTHDRVALAKRRRREELARREAAEREILAHAQQQRDLDRLQEDLTRLGGFRLMRVRTELCIEHVADITLVWAVGAAGTACGAVLLSGLANLGEPAFARVLGWYFFLAGVAALGLAAFARRTRTLVWVSGDGPAFDALRAPRSRELPRDRRRQMVVRELRTLEGAQVTVLPSVWDRLVKRVRRGA